MNKTNISRTIGATHGQTNRKINRKEMILDHKIRGLSQYNIWRGISNVNSNVNVEDSLSHYLETVIGSLFMGTVFKLTKYLYDLIVFKSEN